MAIWVGRPRDQAVAVGGDLGRPSSRSSCRRRGWGWGGVSALDGSMGGEGARPAAGGRRVVVVVVAVEHRTVQRGEDEPQRGRHGWRRPPSRSGRRFASAPAAGTSDGEGHHAVTIAHARSCGAHHGPVTVAVSGRKPSNISKLSSSHYSFATLMTHFPSFFPSCTSSTACGAFSNPSIMCSRYFIRPLATASGISW